MARRPNLPCTRAICQDSPATLASWRVGGLPAVLMLCVTESSRSSASSRRRLLSSRLFLFGWPDAKCDCSLRCDPRSAELVRSTARWRPGVLEDEALGGRDAPRPEFRHRRRPAVFADYKASNRPTALCLRRELGRDRRRTADRAAARRNSEIRTAAEIQKNRLPEPGLRLLLPGRALRHRVRTR